MSLLEHVKWAMEEAREGRSALPASVLEMEGMSGTKTRHLYNNICRWAGTRYLEIGTWKGSSFVSAMWGNLNANATVIDNWSEFGGPRDEFDANTTLHLGVDRASLDVRDEDCFALSEPLRDAAYNVYLYDGAHDFESQRRAITDVWHALTDECVIIVDDWNDADVRSGTLQGLRDVAVQHGFYKTISLCIRLTYDNTHTPLDEAAVDFWNGVGVFVVDKTHGLKKCEATQQ